MQQNQTCQLACGKTFLCGSNKIVGLDLVPKKSLGTTLAEVRKRLTTTTSYFLVRMIKTVSSETSELCEIIDLLLFVSYFASQNREKKFGSYFFDVCCVN